MEYVFLLACIAISVRDILSRKIDNISIVLLLIISVSVTEYEIQDYVLSLVVVFIIAIPLFAMHIWGGGDSKLLLAISPLFLVNQLPDLVVSVLLCGGLLSLIYWFKYHIILNQKVKHGLPYGVAIVCGANLSLYFSKGLPIYS